MFQLETWGSLLRLYGREVEQKHEARRSRQSIIKLQGSNQFSLNIVQAAH